MLHIFFGTVTLVQNVNIFSTAFTQQRVSNVLTNTGVVMTFGVKLLGVAKSKYSILAVLQNTWDPECITVKLCNHSGLTNRTGPHLSIGLSLVDDGQRVSADDQLSHLAVGAHLAPGVVLYGAGQREHCGEESDGKHSSSGSQKLTQTRSLNILLRPGETGDWVLIGGTQGPEPLTSGLRSGGDRSTDANRPSGFTARAEIWAIHTGMS